MWAIGPPWLLLPVRRASPMRVACVQGGVAFFGGPGSTVSLFSLLPWEKSGDAVSAADVVVAGQPERAPSARAFAGRVCTSTSPQPLMAHQVVKKHGGQNLKILCTSVRLINSGGTGRHRMIEHRRPGPCRVGGLLSQFAGSAPSCFPRFWTAQHPFGNIVPCHAHVSW